jgi:hypothetical protein
LSHATVSLRPHSGWRTTPAAVRLTRQRGGLIGANLDC